MHYAFEWIIIPIFVYNVYNLIFMLAPFAWRMKSKMAYSITLVVLVVYAVGWVYNLTFLIEMGIRGPNEYDFLFIPILWGSVSLLFCL